LTTAAICGHDGFVDQSRFIASRHAMPYEHFLPLPGAGNRYYLNEAQRQFLIRCELDTCDGNGWTPEAIAEERDSLNSLDNKELVELITGCQWLGFKGQSLELA